MILGSISIKSDSIEKRTVLSPETIKKLSALNIKILINKGYASQSNISDNELVSLGAEIAEEDKIYQQSDILVKINFEETAKIDLIKKGSVLVLNYFDKKNKETFNSLLKKKYQYILTRFVAQNYKSTINGYSVFTSKSGWL